MHHDVCASLPPVGIPHVVRDGAAAVSHGAVPASPLVLGRGARRWLLRPAAGALRLPLLRALIPAVLAAGGGLVPSLLVAPPAPHPTTPRLLLRLLLLLPGLRGVLLLAGVARRPGGRQG